MLKLTIFAFILLIAAVTLVEMHESPLAMGSQLLHSRHNHPRKDVSNVDPAGHHKYKRSDHHVKTAEPLKHQKSQKVHKKAKKHMPKDMKKPKSASEALGKHAHQKKSKKLHKKH